MPVSHRVFEDGALVVSVAEGRVDDDQLLDWLQRVLDDRSLKADRRSLVDLSRMEDCAVSGNAIRDAAQLAERLYPEGSNPRIAVFAPSDLAFGLMRMYASLTERSAGQVHVFRDGAEARAWLGLTGCDTGQS